MQKLPIIVYGKTPICDKYCLFLDTIRKLSPEDVDMEEDGEIPPENKVGLIRYFIDIVNMRVRNRIKHMQQVRFLLNLKAVHPSLNIKLPL